MLSTLSVIMGPMKVSLLEVLISQCKQNDFVSKSKIDSSVTGWG